MFIRIVIATVLLIITKSQDVPELTLISEKTGRGKKYDMMCIVSGNTSDSAITWIEPLSSKYNKDDYVSQFVPARSSPYNCDINFNLETCDAYWAGIHTGWALQRSWNSSLQPVTDHRWEELNTYYTSGSYEFENIAYLDKPSFKVHLSIRLEKDAHLYLCDDDYPPYGRCYWILIGAYAGGKSAIRKCTGEKVPSSGKKYPQSECWDFRDQALHEPFDLVLNDMEWRHFTVEKNGNSILLWRMEKEKPMLNFTDEEESFSSPYHLSIRSGETPGYWKVHDYAYTFTNKEITTSLGNAIYIKQNNFCLTMFVAMCSQCILKLEVLYVYDKRIIRTVVVQPKKAMSWQEVKVVETLSSPSMYIELRVTSECPNKNCDDPFWAIDKFQMCSETEIRMLSLKQEKDKASCQAIKYPHWYLNQTNLVSDGPAEASCPPGRFGKSCTECAKILGSDKPNCDNTIVCELQADHQSICRCAPGYTGTYCKEKCSTGWYGWNCKESCGYCEFPPCDHITGVCPVSHCLEGFTDAHCKTPLLPVLHNPPTILYVGHTSFTVQIQNNTYEGSGKPSQYKVQYKEESETKWDETEVFYYFNNRPIEIKNLKVLTTYLVRAVLITQDNQSFDKDYVPKINLTTTCAVMERKDITIETSNTSVSLTIMNNSESCAPRTYDVVFVGNIVTELKNFNLKFISLSPVSTYRATITNRLYNKSLILDFTTEEGAPEQVEELSVIRQGVTSITVDWKQPKVANGKIQYYNVKCRHIKYTACGNENIMNEEPEKVIQEESTTTVIKNLHPYSAYSIEVAAVTVMEGTASVITGNTLQTDTPEKSEIPTVIKVKPENTYVTVMLQQPNCTAFKGPITYYLTADCSNMWCMQEPATKNVELVDNNRPIGLSKLQPYSNYTLKINVGRTNGSIFAGHEITEVFNTKPSAPNKITSITAYSKDESSISLRFPPPFPPTGELAEYCFQWCYKKSTWRGLSSENVCKTQYLLPSVCKLWPDLHCASFQQLEEDKLYTVWVQAKNNGTNFNDATSIEAKTIQESPGVLANLTFKWDDYYNLTLTWGHPSITNGPLKKFVVIISAKNSICSEEDFPISEENYSTTYSYTIPLVKCYSSKLKVRVAAFNILEGAPAVLSNVTSPPKVPSFSANVTDEAVTNTTITIKFSRLQDLMSNSVMYVIISNEDPNSKVTKMAEAVPELWSKAEIPNNVFSWIAAEFDFAIARPVQQELVIGNNTKSKSTRLKREIHNQMLQSNTSYLITTIVINEFEGFERYKVHKIKRSTTGMKSDNESGNYVLLALLLLLVIPIILLIVVKKKKKNKSSWFEMFSMSNNMGRQRRNPDVVPLAKNLEDKPSTVQPQIRPKRIIPTEEAVNSTEPSTSRLNDEFSRPVKIIEFEKYVKESIENGELERQHALFPRGQTKPWDYGLLPQNKSKNRYNNLIAYDHTRVKLAKINNDPYSDYINANYIEGYNTKKAYIATQGPKAATVNDFWRMIWQENVNYVVMLANVIEGGKKKSEQYWPNVNECMEFGKIKVEYVSSRVFADYEYRIFLVSCNNVERRVEQMHFTSWPDHGVPLYSQSLVPFLRKMLTIPQGSSPVVVHCSAGVGRTGTIILCDLCLRMAAREGVVDVLKHQRNLREQRANLVDNIEQYKLAHLVLLECLVAMQTSITCDEEMEGSVLRLLESDRVAQQMKYLQDTAWQDQAMRPPLEVTPNAEWAKKNRFQDIIPCRI